MTFEGLINGLDTDENMVYLPAMQNEYSGYTMIFVHTLTAGGSQYAVKMLLRALHEKRIGAVVVSPEDGIYRDIYLDECNTIVVVQNQLIISAEFVRFVQSSFDFVFINSCATTYSQLFIDTDIKVFWWMHEAIQTIIANSNAGFCSPDMLGDNFCFFSPWQRTVSEFNEIFKKEMRRLPLPVEDFRINEKQSLNNDSLISFLIPGSYLTRKGFHNVVSAVIDLPSEILCRATFTFVGFVHEENIYNLVVGASKIFPQIVALNEVTREEMNELYNMHDCVIVPSLLDSGPLTVAEAMMHQKMCLVSNLCGITESLSDGVDCLMFDGNDIEDLKEKIIYIVESFEKLRFIEENARKTYENLFSEEALKESMAECCQ